MAVRIGEGAAELAMHVKGQELPMHEPRIKHALGLGYGLSPTGADHMHNLHDTLVRREGTSLDNLRAFDPSLQPVPATVLNEEKVRLYYYKVNDRHFLDSAVMCIFLPYSPQQMVSLLKAVTGWDLGLEDTQAIGERAITLARIFNLREGFTADEDALPSRFFAPFQEGEPRKAVALDERDLAHARRAYYKMMGWDEESGIPSSESLERLEIGWAARHLPRS
jgi:aldehyde:ferredoxin oxidoreductase